MTSPIEVLVVDDSDDQAELLRKYLERVGCRVITASNASEAIVAYLASTPDLAIIDLLMPGMDGWELIDKLHSDLPSCAIVVTSVLDASDYPAADGILPKPFTGSQVRQVLADTVPRWSAA